MLPVSLRIPQGSLRSLRFTSPGVPAVRLATMAVVGDWELSERIGSGSFAIVWRGRHRVTGLQAAVKEIDVERLSSKLRRSLDGEISILSRISHPNVVKLLEVVEVRWGKGRGRMVGKECERECGRQGGRCKRSFERGGR